MLFLLLACTGDEDAGPVDSAVETDTDTDTDSDGDSDTDTDTDLTPDLWLYVGYNLQVEENVVIVQDLIDRGVAAGYRGMVLADWKIHLLHTDILPEWYATDLVAVLDHAAAAGFEVVPAIFPFGYSDGLYFEDPDLAEGARVTGTPLVAQDGALQVVVTEMVADGGFEAHTGDTFDDWGWQDPRVVADTDVYRSGAASARVDAGSANARIVVALPLPPRRQFHGSFWAKTEGFGGGTVQVIVYDTVADVIRNQNTVSVRATQDWTRYDFTAVTDDSTTISLYAGVWGTSTGQIWFDDISVEETAFVNLIRRDGAPFALHGPSGELVEGADYSGAADPQILVAFDDWHEPPVLATTLADGTEVTADFYAVTPISDYQVGACLTEPAVWDWLGDNLAAVDTAFPDVSGFMLQYDEMRHVNSCASCRATGMDAGELVAWNVAGAIDMVEASRPGSTRYIWSDMFDPHHNAHDNYYLVEGDLTGAWEGLPSDTVIMNWNLGSTDSLTFFADRGHPQIIAGYYDSGDGYTSATTELAAGREMVQGLMYTTWSADFSQLESYAEGARAAW